jgi:hypothetical protein
MMKTAIAIIVVIIAVIVLIFRRPSTKSKTFFSKLLDIKEISHDTKIFTFGLPDDMKTVGLNIGEHLELE